MMQHGLGIDIPNVTAKALPAKDEPHPSHHEDQRLILNEKKIEAVTSRLPYSFFKHGMAEGDIPSRR